MKKLAIFILFFVLLGGCGFEFLISPIVKGVVTWVQGEAHKYYNYDSEAVYRAVKRTAKELNYEITSDDPKENGDYKLVVGVNDKFKISVDRIEPNITLVSIRINFMGDKPYAELFYKELDVQLNTIEFDKDGIPIKNDL